VRSRATVARSDRPTPNGMAEWIRWMILVLILGAFTPQVEAAGRISASLEPSSIEAGGRAIVTVRIDGVTELADPPRVPPVPNLVISRGGQQTNFSMINGKMSRSISYSFVVQASRPGTYSIGPIEAILSPNQVEKSKALNLEVRPAGSRGGQIPDASRPESAEDGMVFVRAVVSDRKVYFGEQVTLKMQFYQARGYRVLETRLESPPETQGFLREELPPQRTRSETIDGRTYQVTELVYALFPTQTGELTIGPAVLECSVEDRRRSGRRSLFDGFGLFGSKRVSLRSQPIRIQVDPLPKPAPDSFTGAVGTFRLRSEVDRTEVGQNEPLTLSVSLDGTGNIAGVGEPSVPEVADFRTFAPAVASLTTRTDKDRIAGKKEFEIVLIPETTGSLIIPPVELSVFRPRSGTYVTLRTDTLRINVIPGSAGTLAGGDVERVGWDLREVREETELVSVSRFHWNSPLGWSFASMPLLLFAGGWWARRRQEVELRDSALLRRRRAARAYGRGLKSLHSNDEEGHRRLDELLSRYIQDRFGFSVQGSPRSELVATLQSNGVKEETLAIVERLFSELDFARFASQGVSRLSDETLNDARTVVEQIELETGKAAPTVIGHSANGGARLSTWLLLFTMILLGSLVSDGAAFAASDDPAQAETGNVLETAPEQLSSEAVAVLFQEATEAYQSRDFARARARYRQIASSGFTSPELWLNLGNTHYRLGEVGWAAYAYERGRRLDPNDPDIRVNLDLATRDHQEVEAESSRLLKLLTDLLDRVSLRQSIGLAVAIWWILALWWVLSAFLRRPAVQRVGGGLAVVLLVALVWTAAEAVREHGRPDSVVVEELRVRSNPDPTSTVEFSLPAGTAVRTGRKTDGFTEVLFSSELQGWGDRSVVIPLQGRVPSERRPPDRESALD